MSTSDAELEYLTAGFDPATLTVPRLRAVLVAHNVSYPASAKKPQLIELFNDHVAPSARRILGARTRIKRTSRGITDMPSSQEGTLSGEEDATLMPPPPVPVAATPRKRSSRKSPKVIGSEESAEELSLVKKTPARKSSVKHARTSDTEAAIEVENKKPVSRKSRKSEVAPVPGSPIEDLKPVRGWEGADKSNFSDDNPFQSGSSPVPMRSPSPDKKRKSLGASIVKDSTKRKSSNNRRKTENYSSTKAEDGIMVPTSNKFEMPDVKLGKLKVESDANGVLAGEEFTPEEQIELVSERLAKGESAVVPHRPRPRKSGGGVKSASWVVFLTLLGGYAAWWRREKLEVGYCGVGRPSTTVANVQIPNWATVLQPECEPCPQHAFCLPRFRTECDHDYILKPHPLSLGGLVPLPPTCEPDGEKVRRVKQVADRVVEELRERRAKYECGEATAVEVNEEELKMEVSKKRRKGMGEAEFEELWSGALGEVMGRDEVVGGIDGTTGHRTLSSTSLARLPIGCAIRRSVKSTLARNSVELTGVGLLLSLLAFLNRYFRSRQAALAKVPSLVALTLDRLASQAAYHAQGQAGESYISVGQLRDDVLRDEFNIIRREAVWKRVKVVVESNANVRASVREGRNGEVGRVWEWIGSLPAIEMGSGTRGRLSIGPIGSHSSSPSREMVETSRWQEGRPIY